MEKKEAAKALYMRGWAQKRIAATLKLAEKTVSAWKLDGNWEAERTEESLAKETVTRRIFRAVNYELEIVEAQIEAENKKPVSERKTIIKPHADGLAKLLSQVKQQVSSWETYVNFTDELVRFLEINHPEWVSEDFTALLDEFLNEKRKHLSK